MVNAHIHVTFGLVVELVAFEKETSQFTNVFGSGAAGTNRSTSGFYRYIQAPESPNCAKTWSTRRSEAILHSSDHTWSCIQILTAMFLGRIDVANSFDIPSRARFVTATPPRDTAMVRRSSRGLRVLAGVTCVIRPIVWNMSIILQFEYIWVTN